MAVANEYEGQPIAFIAVNSGNSREKVAEYVSKNSVTWPVIVDSNRAFEKASGVSEVSLKNIWQFRTFDSNGNLKYASSRDLGSAIDDVLKTAAWNVDPESIPSPLKDVWFAVEFGNYSVAANVIRKTLRSRKPELKSAAEKLNGFVKDQQRESLEFAQTSLDAGNHWAAYKTYAEAKQKFDGYESDVDVVAKLRELKTNMTVTDELAAERMLENATRQIEKTGLKKALARLKKIDKKYPSTEAAKSARELISANE